MNKQDFLEQLKDPQAHSINKAFRRLKRVEYGFYVVAAYCLAKVAGVL
jgi:hypothetical protein